MFEYDFLISVPSQACHGFFLPESGTTSNMWEVTFW